MSKKLEFWENVATQFFHCFYFWSWKFEYIIHQNRNLTYILQVWKKCKILLKPDEMDFKCFNISLWCYITFSYLYICDLFYVFEFLISVLMHSETYIFTPPGIWLSRFLHPNLILQKLYAFSTSVSSLLVLAVITFFNLYIFYLCYIFELISVLTHPGSYIVIPPGIWISRFLHPNFILQKAFLVCNFLPFINAFT